METKEIDIIRKLCKEHHTSVRQLEIELGFSNGSLASSRSIKSDRLYQIAEYFRVPMEYLMTGTMPSVYDLYGISEDDLERLNACLQRPAIREIVDLCSDVEDSDINVVTGILKRFHHSSYAE